MKTNRMVEAAEEWEKLDWKTVRLQSHPFKTRPIRVIDCPDLPGLYRMTLTDPDWWRRVKVHLPIAATKKISDAQIESSNWQLPVRLSIGRTTSLSKRIEQHLGTNQNSNRLLKRLRLAFEIPDDELRELAIQGLQVEVAIVPEWTKRFVLERYGIAVEQPFLDFDAEH